VPKTKIQCRLNYSAKKAYYLVLLNLVINTMMEITMATTETATPMIPMVVRDSTTGSLNSGGLGLRQSWRWRRD